MRKGGSLTAPPFTVSGVFSRSPDVPLSRFLPAFSALELFADLSVVLSPFGLGPADLMGIMGHSHALVNGTFPCYMLCMARSLKAEAAYEARGQRPGVQFSIRLSDEEAAAVDDKRGKQARAAWVKDLIRKELRLNRPTSPTKKPKPRAKPRST